jgi:hypothetical protein
VECSDWACFWRMVENSSYFYRVWDWYVNSFLLSSLNYICRFFSEDLDFSSSISILLQLYSEALNFSFNPL